MYYFFRDHYEMTLSDFVILDSVAGKQLACCPFVHRVLFGRESSPSVVHFWNMCGLSKEHCNFHGRRLKFSSYGIDCLRVVWVCPRIVDFSFLEGK